MRRRFMGEFKGRVSLEALRGEKAVHEIALQHKAHPNQALNPGDIIALPDGTPHACRSPGPGELRLVGIHANPRRIVHRLDANG